MAEWVTSEVAAEFLGVSRPTIYKMVEDGRLQPLKYVNGRMPIFDMDYLRHVKPNLQIAETGRRVSKPAGAA